MINFLSRLDSITLSKFGCVTLSKFDCVTLSSLGVISLVSLVFRHPDQTLFEALVLWLLLDRHIGGGENFVTLTKYSNN